MTVNARSTKLGYTTSEAARRLGVSLSTIRRWSDHGYLHGYRTPGGQRRFSAQQLDEFLTSLESDGPLRPTRGDEGPGESRVHRHHVEPPASPVQETGFATEYAPTSLIWPPADRA